MRFSFMESFVFEQVHLNGFIARGGAISQNLVLYKKKVRASARGYKSV